MVTTELSNLRYPMTTATWNKQSANLFVHGTSFRRQLFHTSVRL